MESFHSLLRKRFEGKDNSVPWYLDDKVNAFSFVEKQNVKHANIIAILEDIGEIKDIDLPDNFVIKISHAHNTIGVMLLEKISVNQYFDHLSLNQYDLDSLISTQRKIGKQRENNPFKVDKQGIYWLVEELLENFLPNNFIPFDYKVYCFHGQPTLIFQVDRNSSPPKAAIFDGTFMPLIYGKDYDLNPKRLVPGNHILPSHPISILKIAHDLSTATNDIFVSIDLYDTPNGVYFGELTFASGFVYAEMVKFSYNILYNLDSCLNDKKKPDINFPINNSIFPTNKNFLLNHEKINKIINKINNDYDYHNDYINQLLIKAYSGNLNAIRKIQFLFSQHQYKITDNDIKLLYQHFSLCWKMIAYNYGDKNIEYDIVRDVNNKTGFVKNKTRNMDNFVQDCKNYLYSKGLRSGHYKIRHAQFILEFSNDEQEKKIARDILNDYSAQGNETAKYLLEKY